MLIMNLNVLLGPGDLSLQCYRSWGTTVLEWILPVFFNNFNCRM